MSEMMIRDEQQLTDRTMQSRNLALRAKNMEKRQMLIRNQQSRMHFNKYGAKNFHKSQPLQY